MNQIKNIVFDLGGAIVGLHLARCLAAFRSLNMERIAQIVDPYYPAETLKKGKKGDISLHQAGDQMRIQSGMHPSERLFTDDGARNITTAQKLGFEVYMPTPKKDYSHLFEGLGA